MFGLGGWEIALLVLAGLVFFGPKKLPQLMRQAGKIMHEVKKASSEFQFSIERELEDDEYKRQHRRSKKRAKKLEQKGITEDPAQPAGAAAVSGAGAAADSVPVAAPVPGPSPVMTPDAGHANGSGTNGSGTGNGTDPAPVTTPAKS